LSVKPEGLFEKAGEPFKRKVKRMDTTINRLRAMCRYFFVEEGERPFPVKSIIPFSYTWKTSPLPA
jgi:hypothetical protein